MGAGAVPETGRGRRRSLDAVINVVPAIDLLSCCIAFLLFTAVWTQVSRLEVQPLGAPAEPAPRDTVPLTVSLTARGYRVAVGGDAPLEIPLAGVRAPGEPRYDLKALQARLGEVKARYPAQTAVTLSAEDAVAYRDLVEAIDACVGAGLPGVAVASAG